MNTEEAPSTGMSPYPRMTKNVARKCDFLVQGCFDTILEPNIFSGPVL